MQHISTQVETWKPVVGWEGWYEVSDHGKVRSVARTITRSDGKIKRFKSREIVPWTRPDGYLTVKLARSGERQSKRVNRLVLESFVGVPAPGMDSSHNDGNPSNNRLENLRWDTRSGNFKDKERHGTDYQRNKTHCPRGHELSVPNLDQSKLKKGHRGCLSCDRARSRVYRYPSLHGFVNEFADSYYQKIMKAKVNEQSM